MQQMQRAEMELWKADEELTDLYENAPCGYHSCDAEGVVIRMNETELGWLGYSRAEIVGKVRLSALVSERFRADYESAFAKLKATGAPINIESELTRKNASTLPVQVSAVGVTDARGMFLKSKASVFDITKRKQVEHKARRYASQLQALSRRLVELQDHERRWLAGELHDRIAQNLTALNLNLAAAGCELSPQSGERVNARLEDCLRLVKETVESAFDLMTELRPAVLDDYGLVATLRWYGEQFARRTGIMVTVKGHDLVPRLAQAVETALFRIVQEACTNIARFAKARVATITVTTEPQGVRVEVADDGCGFDPDAVAWRGDHHAGGLLIMRERAEIAGGRLQIESAAGRGTRITVEIRS
ncbi:MAG: PAS domain S-box protein [Betaproteobacteria bacterium]|nr:PAS domain S-box protein [Betaproteobacteria bacterium]